MKNHPVKEILRVSFIKGTLNSFWKRRKMIIARCACFRLWIFHILHSHCAHEWIHSLVTNISPLQTSGLNTLLLIIDLAALPLFGLLASRFFQAKMMVMAAACAALSGIPLFLILEGATLFYCHCHSHLFRDHRSLVLSDFFIPGLRA